MPYLLDQTIYDERELLLLISEDGDNYAFQLLYNKYKDNVYRVAYRTLKSAVGAQEVVQDVFLKLWIERKNILNIQSLENWLYIVAKNHLLNQLKKNTNEWKNRSKYQLDAILIPEIPLNDLDKKIYIKLHQNAIATLTNHQRNVYELVRINHFSHIQVAEKMNISPLTVKKHMSRALFQIRKVLKDSGFMNMN